MAKRLMDYDSFTGISTYHDYDPDTKKTVITQEQDVEAILKANQILANDESHKQKGLKNDFLHVATIPLTLISKWLMEDKIDVFNPAHKHLVARKLNDPAYKYLKTVSNFRV